MGMHSGTGMQDLPKTISPPFSLTSSTPPYRLSHLAGRYPRGREQGQAGLAPTREARPLTLLVTSRA